MADTRRGFLALAGGSFLAGAGSASAAPQAGPDAELIAACREHLVARDALDDAPDIEDDDPRFAAYDRTQKTICEAKPQTIDGVVAKARAAKAIGTDPNGDEDPAGCMAEIWAWDIVNDLVRIHGRAST